MSDKLQNFRILQREFINAYALRDLAISDLSGIQNGECLVWDTSSNSWIPGTTAKIQFTGVFPNRAIYIGDTNTLNQSPNSLAFGNYAGNLRLKKLIISK